MWCAFAVAALILCSPAGAEGTFAIAAGSFATELSTNQAGAHPDLRTRFHLDVNSDGSPVGGTPKDLNLDLPPGLIGVPTAAPACSIAQVADVLQSCPAETAVGTVTVRFSGSSTQTATIYNITPYPGEPAAFAFRALYPARIDTHLRADGDYGLTVTSTDLTEAAAVTAVDLTLWGVPADHNGSGSERRPLMTNPTECSGAALTSTISLDPWLQPGVFTGAEYSLGAITGCDRLEFAPTIDTRPTTDRADAPSGLDLDLHFPQNPDPDGFATPHLRDAVLSLPTGMTLNPASAGGQAACSPEQAGVSAAGRSDGVPAHCPNESKLGSVEAASPAIGHPLAGRVYLATPEKNPFGTLFAFYLTIEDPLSGIVVKLPGKVDLDPRTGQLTTSIGNSPQFPFEDLKMHLFGGDRGLFRTPAACGEHRTVSILTPWSSPAGADATPSSSFALGGGPGGGACLPSGAAAPNRPSFAAGSLDPTAKAFSPFVLELGRADGSQPLRAIDVTLPRGLLGRLAGIAYCPAAALAGAAGRSGGAESAAPSCPAASQIGSVEVGAGAGPAPLNISGKAYLAGPYRGAPLSLAVVVPALAGPFDLGTVVVRTALQVDPLTAQIQAASDPIPTILRGVPLDLRSVYLSLDRPGFTRNPTNCDPAAVLGGATSVFEQRAAVSDPFQVGDCARLGFRPKLSVALSGPTHRSAHPRLRLALTAPRGGANLARAALTLPPTEHLEISHVRDVCTRERYAAGTCPRGSIYGYAKAWSPLLERPLRGPVYLRASSRRFPDLVASLDGQVHIDLSGRIDSTHARIRNTFAAIPDVPISKFVLEMQGGSRGLLVNNTELCRAKPRVKAEFTGQNGKISVSNPLVETGCGRSPGKR